MKPGTYVRIKSSKYTSERHYAGLYGKILEKIGTSSFHVELQRKFRHEHTQTELEDIELEILSKEEFDAYLILNS